MSDSHPQSSAAEGAHEESHEGPIKTPRQLIWTVVAAFVVPVVIIILLVNFVVMQDKPAAGTAALDEEAVAKRIRYPRHLRCFHVYPPRKSRHHCHRRF